MDYSNNSIDNKYLNSNIDDEDFEARNRIYYKNTYIYGWGKNKYGELGIGHTNNQMSPT
jgi:hypothetical protein